MESKKKVLFVDDNKMDRIILSRILKQLDLDFVEAATAEEFLPQIKEYNPDLCLVDLNIQQNNDGRILIKAIRNILGDNLPIIIISAVEETEQIAENLQNGANDFICKPIDQSLLSSKISNYLHNKSIDSRVLPLFKIPKEVDRTIVMGLEMKLVEFSEDSLTIKSDVELQVGAEVFIENSFLLKVFPEFERFCLKIESQQGELYTGKITDFTDEDMPKLRRHLTNLQLESDK